MFLVLAIFAGASASQASLDQRFHLDPICPFLGTMVNEKALPIRDWYSKRELTDFVLNAGLQADEAMGHIFAQFRRIATNKIDIFNMEGLPDEHTTSSGINDCKTDYSHAESCPAPDSGPMHGVPICPTEQCAVPNQAKLDFFWDFFKENEHLTASSLQSRTASFTQYAVDQNTGDRVRGTLADAFKFLMQVFTNGKSKMNYDDLVTININRKYPPGYSFGETSGCDPATEYPARTIQYQDDGIMHSFQFKIKSPWSEAYLAVDGSGKVRQSSTRQLWTAVLTDGSTNSKNVSLRSSKTGQFLSGKSDGTLGVANEAGSEEQWLVEQYTGEQTVVFLNHAQYGYRLAIGPGGLRTVQQYVTNDDRLSLVYCTIPGGSPCTGGYMDPWSSGEHVPCCGGTTETLNKWNLDRDDYYKCIPNGQCPSSLNNVDCQGYDFKDQAMDTPEGCCSLCAGDSKCKAYTHNKIDGHGAPHCYLKTGCNTLQDGSGSESTTGVLGANLLYQTDCNGNDIVQNGITCTTIDSCLQFCQETPGCSVWTFDRYHTLCWLKTKCTRKDCDFCVSGTLGTFAQGSHRNVTELLV